MKARVDVPVAMKQPLIRHAHGLVDSFNIVSVFEPEGV